MNPTHIHLLLNHFPIIGTLIGSFILIFGVIRKNNTIIQTALVVLFLMALAAIPVYLTGEPAEESVEKLPGVSEALIEAHEDAASIAIWLIELTGLLALAGWLTGLRGSRWMNRLQWITIVASLLTFAAMARTGYLGGQIRHTEIRSGASVNGNQQDTGEANKAAKEDDD